MRLTPLGLGGLVLCAGVASARESKRAAAHARLASSSSVDHAAGFREAFLATGLTDADLARSWDAHASHAARSAASSSPASAAAAAAASSFLATGRPRTTLSCVLPGDSAASEMPADHPSRLGVACCKEAAALERVASTELMLSYVNLGDVAVSERVKKAVKALSPKETGSLVLSLVLTAVAGPLAGKLMGSMVAKVADSETAATWGLKTLSEETIKTIKEKPVSFVVGKVKSSIKGFLVTKAPGLAMESKDAEFMDLIDSFFKDAIEELMRSTRIALRGPEPGDFEEASDDLIHDLSRQSLSARCERAAAAGDAAVVAKVRSEMADLRRLILTGLAMKTSKGEPGNVKKAWEEIFAAAEAVGKIGLDKRGSWAGTASHLEVRGLLPAFLLPETDAARRAFTPPGGAKKAIKPLALVNFLLKSEGPNRLSFPPPQFSLHSYIPAILGPFVVFLTAHRDMEVTVAEVGRVIGAQHGGPWTPEPPAEIPAESYQPSAFYTWHAAARSSFRDFLRQGNLPHALATRRYECVLAGGTVRRLRAKGGPRLGHCSRTKGAAVTGGNGGVWGSTVGRLMAPWASAEATRATCPRDGGACGTGDGGNRKFRDDGCEDGICVCVVIPRFSSRGHGDADDRSCECVSHTRKIDANNCEWAHDTMDLHFAHNDSPFRMYFNGNIVSDYNKDEKSIRHDNQRRGHHLWMRRHDAFHGKIDDKED
eukprot:TRINITY_DN818_c0_g1_i2.p2 TRINITY_DN818_c0_g1~~TRINITY_DN818_c0_g1_i2.p2  ORF type:complete len:752 (+),score=377.62 TRINITY_DN818_c0_g1_i2:122-2257(+)